MSNRLWFRVEDVLPLAEHALACPTHRLTRAQMTAGEHNTAALALRRRGSSGSLRSNGVPLWHTSAGIEQVADGASWRRVDQSPPPEQHFYLPLRHADPDGRRLIDVLRAGRSLERTWLAVDTDVWPGTTLDAAHVDLVDHRAEIAPAGTRWRPAVVTSPRVDHRCYPALVADGYDTGEDGNLICRFDPHTTRHLVEDLSGPWRAATMPGEHPLPRFDGTCLVLLEEMDLGDGIRLTINDRCYPDRDGYYSIGAYQWQWRAVSRPTRAGRFMPLRSRLRLETTAVTGRLRDLRARRQQPPTSAG
ncbi:MULTISPECIES: hypothetical protein [unclassified Micromonospora]|uniref:hypothetical protein n=1 Tax=unclassified Micromonospora TaxID=2617518 RepID=UPI001C21DC8A|nr:MULTISPECIES: hypothetical protein [unclassified Micromonospora]MBU8857746.1 hypothetical protein [Micromonospora sp. WMMB482]MDM4783373.1 hypothetical protein [Micromonospora sp. b486]